MFWLLNGLICVHRCVFCCYCCFYVCSYAAEQPLLKAHPSGRRKSSEHREPADRTLSNALRGADLSSELLPLHSHSSRFYMGFFYVGCVLVVYALFKLYPANKFRVRKIVGRMQGQDLNK